MDGENNGSSLDIEEYPVPDGTLAPLAMSALLFGVTPTDPLTYAAVSGVLAAVALLGTWLPARRASRVDPIVALRADVRREVTRRAACTCSTPNAAARCLAPQGLGFVRFSRITRSTMTTSSHRPSSLPWFS